MAEAAAPPELGFDVCGQGPAVAPAASGTQRHRAPGELPAALVQRFEQHEWFGNVRELQAAVWRAIVTAERDVGPKKRGASADAITELIDRGLPLPRARQEIVLELERRYTQAMLDRHGGSLGKAAAASGIGRRYFQAIRAKK